MAPSACPVRGSPNRRFRHAGVESPAGRELRDTSAKPIGDPRMVPLNVDPGTLILDTNVLVTLPEL